MRLQDLPNTGEMKSPEGIENSGRKRTSGLRNMDILPQYLGKYKIQRDSILIIGMRFSRKKTNGKCQISGKESHGWCFVTWEVWEAELSEVFTLNTKGADVAYLRSRYEKPRC